MIDKITKLVSMGYSAKSILDTLMKKSPNAAKKIGKALALGYAPTTVLSKLLINSTAKPDVYKTELEQAFKAQEEQRQKGLRQFVTAANLIGAAGFGLGRAAGMLKATKASGKVLPQIGYNASQPAQSQIEYNPPPPAPPQTTEPSIPPQIGYNAPPKESPYEGMKKVAERLPEIPRKPMSKEEAFQEARKRMATKLPEAPVEKVVDAGFKLEKDFPHLKTFVTKHLEKGIDPETVYDKLQKSGMYKGIVKRYEDITKSSYLNRIYDMVEEVGREAKPSEKMQRGAKSLQDVYKEQAKLSKKETSLDRLLDKLESELGL